MLSFSGFRLEDGSPIYQQIIRYLEQGIAAGTIRDGDGLRSLRQMGLTRPEAAALIDRLWDSPELEEEKP